MLIFSADGRGEVLLSQLKQHPETRHRPVFVAGPSGGRMSALRAGAAGYLEGARGTEAVTHVAQALDDFNARAVRRLALIEDGTGLDPATMTLLGAGEDVDVVKMSFDDGARRAARRRRGLRGAAGVRRRRRGLRPARAGSRPTAPCASCRSSSTPPSRSRAASARAWTS